ncbi:MAG: phage tail tip fiber protein, partial [Plesiomonas shigelloides]
SQVFLAASQVFAYDPNNPASSAPVFAIDQGKVVIQEALIKKAIIQTIHAEKITADYIKSGVSISAPLISGGSFDMGNAYMSGGAAGFGLGGPYSGWGKGWNSIIYSDGSIYTNRLNAEGGNIRDMRMERCVIAESCDVRGTLYAEKIVGDIVRTYAMGIGSVVTVEAVPFARLVQWQVIVSSGRESTTATATLNGGGVGSLSATRIMYDVVGAPGFVNSIPVPVPKSAVFTASIPAHQSATLGLTGSIGRDGAASAVAIISKI